MPVNRVQAVRARRPAAARHRDAHGATGVPALFVQDGAVVKSLPSVITQLRDARFSDDEIVDWLFREDDSLPGSPIDALRGNRGSEIKRRAQVAGVLSAAIALRRDTHLLVPRAYLAACLSATVAARGVPAAPGCTRDGDGCCCRSCRWPSCSAVWDMLRDPRRLVALRPGSAGRGRLPGRLPIEELLFFLVIPTCAVLTLEAVRGAPADVVDRRRAVTYTLAAVLGVLAAATLDLVVLRTTLLPRAAFWTAYAIVLVGPARRERRPHRAADRALRPGRDHRLADRVTRRSRICCSASPWWW